MARQFTPNEFMSLGSALVTEADYPFTFACWFKVPNVTTNYMLMSTARIGNNLHFHTMYVAGSIAGDPVRVGARGGSTSANWAKTTSGYSANVWHHACGVFAANNDRRAYLDGGSKGTTATGRNPASIDQFYLGRYEAGIYLNGHIAEAAVWNVALDDAEIASLGKGFRPLLVRPASLLAYWSGLRFPDDTTKMNDFFGNNLTGTSTGESDHPRRIG